MYILKQEHSSTLSQHYFHTLELNTDTYYGIYSPFSNFSNCSIIPFVIFFPLIQNPFKDQACHISYVSFNREKFLCPFFGKFHDTDII